MERAKLTMEDFGVPCPVCRRTWMAPQPSGPTGLRYRCDDCRAVVVMPPLAAGSGHLQGEPEGVATMTEYEYILLLCKARTQTRTLMHRYRVPGTVGYHDWQAR